MVETVMRFESFRLATRTMSAEFLIRLMPATNEAMPSSRFGPLSFFPIRIMGGKTSTILRNLKEHERAVVA
jgi:hypothetical protein